METLNIFRLRAAQFLSEVLFGKYFFLLYKSCLVWWIDVPHDSRVGCPNNIYLVLITKTKQKRQIPLKIGDHFWSIALNDKRYLDKHLLLFQMVLDFIQETQILLRFRAMIWILENSSNFCRILASEMNRKSWISY